MTWRGAGRLVLVVLLAGLAGALWRSEARFLVWGLYFAGVIGLGWVSRRRWSRRVAELGEAEPEERDRRIAELPPDDQSLARLELGIRTDEGIDPADGETFTYRRTPKALLALAFWGCVVMSALPLTLIAFGQVWEDQVLWAFVVGAGFAIGAVGALLSGRSEAGTVRLTASGIVEESATGKRTGILWSEIESVRPRPLLKVLEVTAHDGRCIHVGYTLDGFPRFMELLSARLQELDADAAGPPD